MMWYSAFPPKTKLLVSYVEYAAILPNFKLARCLADDRHSAWPDRAFEIVIALLFPPAALELISYHDLRQAFDAFVAIEIKVDQSQWRAEFG